MAFLAVAFLAVAFQAVAFPGVTADLRPSPMTDRYLVTGATGLVGARAARALRGSGADVIALSRDPASAERSVPAITKAYPWTDRGPLPGEALEGARAVIHLAGESVAGRWTEERKRRIEASRIEGTRRLVDAIAALPAGSRPAVLVSASAIGYYGDTGEREARESDPPAHDFLATVCVSWEREARRAERLGVRVVTPRLGLVLAREGGALERMLPLFKAGLGGKIGRGTQWWPWIHVDDVIGLARHAIDTPDLHGAINATAPGIVRQAEFAKALAKVLHRPAFLPAPELAIRTVLGEFATEVLASRRVICARAIESGYAFRFPEVAGALADLLG